MDESAAEARAGQFLATLALREAVVALDRRKPPLRRSWCHVYFWNTRRYLSTRHPLDSMADNGPIVVPLDGSTPFLLPTYASPEELLDEYERRYGLGP